MDKILRDLIKSVLVIALAIVGTGQPAMAQSPNYGLRANIPFDFIVGNQTVPAGTYSFKRARQDDDLVLQISNLAGKTVTFRNTILVTTLKPKDKSILIFHRYDNKYFLSEVWSAGTSAGRSLPPSRSERDILRKETLASSKRVESETVNVVAY